MAEGVAKTIDQLPDKESISGTDMFPLDDGAQSYKTTWEKLLKLTGGIKDISPNGNTITFTFQDGTTATVTVSDNSKQNVLTWDSEPTKSSENAVNSGAVWAADNDIKEALDGEIKTARAAEEANATAITEEAETARAAEEANATAITGEIRRATMAEQTIAETIDSFGLYVDEDGDICQI